MVKQVKPLSDAENIGFGLLCGFTDVALFQPMNYWKNAVQQSLPFTLNPSLLYRGVAANLANNSFCVGAQFWLNGVWRKMITGGVNRDLSNIEKVGGGVFAGAASSLVAGPIELVMIQQQRKGGTLLDTTLKMLQGGHIFRGTIAMAAREGLCAAAQILWRAILARKSGAHIRRNALTLRPSSQVRRRLSRRDAGRAAVRAGQLQGLDRRDARPRSVLGGDDVHPVRLGVLAPARHDQDVLAGRRRADDVQGVHADHAGATSRHRQHHHHRRHHPPHHRRRHRHRHLTSSSSACST